MKKIIYRQPMGIVTFSALILTITALIASLALWTERTLEFWLSHFKGDLVDVPYWLSLLLTLVLNGVILAVNIFSEILRLLI